MYTYIANSKQILNVVETNNTWLGFHNNNFLMKTSEHFFLLVSAIFLEKPIG